MLFKVERFLVGQGIEEKNAKLYELHHRPLYTNDDFK